MDERTVLLDGARDEGNQYAFAVMVSATLTAGETLKCTGVLINPQAVLTAGHCVCARHASTEGEGRARFIIDRSKCAEEVSITTVAYHPQGGAPGGSAGIQAGTYRARVRTHPGIRVLLDEQSAVLSSHADLAMAFMEEPASDLPSHIEFAATDVEEGEVILIAGYGFDAINDLIHGVRRSGQKRVTEVLEGRGGDSALFEAYGGEFTTGSGEPCMRREEKGVSLLGISSNGLGPPLACTRILPHRGWLEAEVRRARGEATGEGSAPE